MYIKQVQEKVFTEPKKDPAEALQYFIAFAEGLRGQKAIGQPSTSAKIKGEPVFEVTRKGNRRECWRSGAVSLTATHVEVCKARETNFNHCGIKGHFEKCCNSKQKVNLRKMAIQRTFYRRERSAKTIQSVEGPPECKIESFQPRFK